MTPFSDSEGWHRLGGRTASSRIATEERRRVLHGGGLRAEVESPGYYMRDYSLERSAALRAEQRLLLAVPEEAGSGAQSRGEGAE